MRALSTHIAPRSTLFDTFWVHHPPTLVTGSLVGSGPLPSPGRLSGLFAYITVLKVEEVDVLTHTTLRSHMGTCPPTMHVSHVDSALNPHTDGGPCLHPVILRPHLGGLIPTCPAPNSPFSRSGPSARCKPSTAPYPGNFLRKFNVSMQGLSSGL